MQLPTFALGMIVATPGALASVPHGDMMTGLIRHCNADWGDVCADDAAANDAALVNGARLLSAYHTEAGEKFWIITEADRSVTTVLLPDEY